MRRVILLGGWLVVAGLAGLLALWAVGVTVVPFDWLWAYTPHLYLPVWLVVVLAGVTRSRALGASALLVASVHVAILLPPMIGSPATGERDLRVVSANVRVSNSTVGAFTDELREIDADVVVMQEVTPLILDDLDALAAVYEHDAFMVRDDPLGAAVYSRLPLTDVQVVDAGGVPMLTTVVDVRGEPVRLWNVHTTAPASRHGQRLRDGMLRAMGELARREPLPLLAIGDYNATTWHPAFDDFVDGTGLRDAHDAVGRGLVGTWKSFPIEPLIDHVVVSDHWSILRVAEGDGPGSDHRPVVVDLAFSEH